MEIYPYYFLTFAFLIAMVLPFLKSKAFPAKPDNFLRLPPGPQQLPVLGSLHHLIFRRSHPHRALCDMARKYGPLMLLKIGETPTIIASSVETAKEIMKTKDTCFAMRPINITAHTVTWGGRDIMFAPYGDYWRQTLKVCMTKLLSPKRIQAYRFIREEEVKNLIHNITTGMESTPLLNITELMTTFVSDVTVRAITGANHKEHPEFLRAWVKTLELNAGSNLVDLFPSKLWLTNIVSGARYDAERCKRIMGGLLDNIIKMKMERNAISDATDTDDDDDLLDALLKMHKGEGVRTPLEMDNIKAVLMDLMGAGVDTTAITLDWVTSELLRHPSVLKIAQAEVRSVLNGKPMVTDEDVRKLPYIQNVIKESLRLHPPGVLLPRLALDDCSVIGYDIPRNTKLLVNAWALGRDPKYWDDADSFKPERFSVHEVDYIGTKLEYIPFGAGRRQCPGNLFGIATVELCLSSLLYHFDWELPHGMRPEKLDMSESFGVSIRRKNHLYLRPVLRIPYPAT